MRNLVSISLNILFAQSYNTQKVVSELTHTINLRLIYAWVVFWALFHWSIYLSFFLSLPQVSISDKVSLLILQEYLGNSWPFTLRNFRISFSSPQRGKKALLGFWLDYIDFINHLEDNWHLYNRVFQSLNIVYISIHLYII